MSNLLDKASIILTPTAYDNGKVLCVKPSTAPYGDFDFSRNTSATRVSAQGLIENVQILSSNLVSNGDFSQEGVDILSGWDFTSGWTEAGSTSITDSNTFTTTTTSGILSPNDFIVGKTYKLDIAGTTSATSFGVRSGYTNTLTDGLTGSFSTTVYFEATDVNIYLRNVGAGVTDITSLSAKEVGQDWTLGTGWSIGSSLASCDGTQTAGTQLTQNGTYTINKIYKITYTVIVTAGNVDIRLQGSGATVTGTTQTTSGAYTEYLTSTGNTSFRIRGNPDFIGSITNISVIEITDDTNLPRINYSGFSFDGSGNIIPNSGCGAWLFEPQTTQLVPYSEALTSGSWSTSGGSTPIFEGGYLAPDGTNTAFKVSNANKNSSLFYGTIVLSTSLRSIYARTISGTGTAQLLSHNSNTNNTFTITEQWQRFDVNSANSTGDTNFYAVDFRGSGTLSEIILWGANATNDQDYATSYIPTEGTIKTRNQDLCNNGGDASLINSTEGVLYVEIAALANDGAFRLLGFSDGTSANRIYIGYSSVNNITCSVQVSSSAVYDFNLTADITINSKLALKYKGNDFAVWVNGVEVDSQSSGNTFPVGTLTQMQFTSAASSSPFYGKTKALAVWKEALTDAELTALTTI